ncbi:MAG: cytochrome d ubiquinol oxidase subunit II [Sedimentisphaerales bacterium]|nr:cytochrome d ubiquinol oxidase subunit II [Sedimentisphaerales bacterium]
MPLTIGLSVALVVLLGSGDFLGAEIARAQPAKLAGGLWYLLLLAAAFLIYSWFATKLYANYLERPVLFVIVLTAVAGLVGVKVFLDKQAYWKGWVASAVTIAACTFFGIVGLYPVMLPSTIEPEVNSITMTAAASSHLTLKIMLVVVIIFVPLAVMYQVWAYRLFSGKVEQEELIY